MRLMLSLSLCIACVIYISTYCLANKRLVLWPFIAKSVEKYQANQTKFRFNLAVHAVLIYFLYRLSQLFLGELLSRQIGSQIL